MLTSITLFRVGGIDVRIHWTFVLVLIFAAFSYSAANQGSTWGAIFGIVSILLLFACVTLHELGHALLARYFHIQVPHITLLPIGGVAQLERMPDRPFQEFLIAIAGPLVNFAISLVLLPAWLLVHSYEVNQGITQPLGSNLFSWVQQIMAEMRTPGLGNLLGYLVWVNASLGLFNLLPAFPMDGGRILRAILATAMPYVQATRIAVVVGRVFAVLLAVWGLTGGGIAPLLIAFFVYVGGGSEREAVESRAILRDIPIRDALTPSAASLYVSERLSRAVDLIMHSYQADYPVLDLAGKFVGVLTRPALVAALRQTGPEARVVDVMVPADQLPVLPIQGSVADVWEKMMQSGSRIVMIQENNEFRGLLSLDDVTELFQVMGATFERNMQNPLAASTNAQQAAARRTSDATNQSEDRPGV